MPISADFVTKYGPWAVITGASSGIGAEFARQIAGEGISVVLVARREQNLQDLSAQISEAYPVDTKIIVADLATPEGLQSIVDETADIDVGLLVNNAGVELHGSFFRDPVDKHLNLINLNVTAVTVLAHSFGRRFADNGRGGIIFVSSIASLPGPWMSSYGPSKSFVTSLSLILREELSKKGVNVMVLEPGLVQSEMSEKARTEVDVEALGMSMQSTSDCVSETLKDFSKSVARTTPGLFNSVSIRILRMLPSPLVFMLTGKILDKAMDPRALEYHEI